MREDAPFRGSYFGVVTALHSFRRSHQRRSLDRTPGSALSAFRRLLACGVHYGGPLPKSVFDKPVCCSAILIARLTILTENFSLHKSCSVF